MKRVFSFAVCFFTILISFSQQVNVYPTNWWVGMKNTGLQLVIHEKDPDKIIAVDKLVVRSSSPDLKIIKVNKVENRRYLFLDCEISPNAKPQTVTISFGGIIASEWRKFARAANYR